MKRHVRLFLCLAVAVLVGAGLTVVGVIVTPTTAGAATGNPWTYSMSNANADGLVIRGSNGTNNPLVVFDHLNQPIAAVAEAGGFKVFGDNIGVNPGSDIYHSQVTISPDDPIASVCVRAGQLWVGGPAGHVWRCAGSGQWTVLL
jgi:hypothetical protein